MHATCDQFEDWDDDPWDAFLADDYERDPQPEPGDFYLDADDANGKGGDPCYR